MNTTDVSTGGQDRKVGEILEQYDQVIVQQLRDVDQSLRQLSTQLTNVQNQDFTQDSTILTRLQQMFDLQQIIHQEMLQMSQRVDNNSQIISQNAQLFGSIQQMLQMLITNIIPEQNISRRNHNRLCHETDALLPILNEQTGLVPTNFPATKADLAVIDPFQLDQLLAFYNLPFVGFNKEKHLLFSQFIGID